jgi:flagellar basal body-associated protein FliL
MKHDYMTNRTWKLDEEITPNPTRKTRKSITLILTIIFILCAAAVTALAWDRYKHHNAAEQPTTIAEINSSQAAGATIDSTAPSTLNTSS